MLQEILKIIKWTPLHNEIHHLDQRLLSGLRYANTRLFEDPRGLDRSSGLFRFSFLISGSVYMALSQQEAA